MRGRGGDGSEGSWALSCQGGERGLQSGHEGGKAGSLVDWGASCALVGLDC